MARHGIVASPEGGKGWCRGAWGNVWTDLLPLSVTEGQGSTHSRETVAVMIWAVEFDTSWVGRHATQALMRSATQVVLLRLECYIAVTCLCSCREKCRPAQANTLLLARHNAAVGTHTTPTTWKWQSPPKHT